MSFVRSDRAHARVSRLQVNSRSLAVYRSHIIRLVF